jgi:molybdopterin/thiamine biosynthesis adenylyltransferase
VGLGGLGGHVIETLARLGVGRIAGVDGDVFFESNLNRQLLSNVENLGRTKAEQAGLHVRRVNPAVEFVGYSASFQSEADRIFSDCDLVFDCLDSIPERRVLAETCASAGLTLVHGAIAGWSGQVAVCPAGSGVLDRLYAGGTRGVETQLGTLPFTAAVAANLMVAVAVPLLLGRPAPSRPALQFFDLLDGDWETIQL